MQQSVEARAWMGLLAIPGRLGPIAMLATLAPGNWMMVVSWGHQPWIAAAFAALLAMIPFGVIASVSPNAARLPRRAAASAA